MVETRYREREAGNMPKKEERKRERDRERARSGEQADRDVSR
jgi:hypothetical protein